MICLTNKNPIQVDLKQCNKPRKKCVKNSRDLIEITIIKLKDYMYKMLWLNPPTLYIEIDIHVETLAVALLIDMNLHTCAIHHLTLGGLPSL